MKTYKKRLTCITRKNYKVGEYRNIEQLKNYTKKKRNKFSVSLCQRMIDNITIWLKLLIDQYGGT
jgi:hypothetical protein